MHGRHFKNPDLGHQVDDATWGRVLKHVYQVEDAQDLARILGRQYHAVVGNPPYIQGEDLVIRAAYRELFASCHGKYAMSVPFIERFFDLALGGGCTGPIAGYVGMIVANSFMKREFGKKLIEEVMPTLDLTHVVDTSGAYIPGHGTPTAILFGRNRAPVEGEVRTVMGIKGEPATPNDPGLGQVWSAILQQVDQVGSEGEFVSVTDGPREAFGRHPWSIGGGGKADLKLQIDNASNVELKDLVEDLGMTAYTGEDVIYEGYAPKRFDDILNRNCAEIVLGDSVRDHTLFRTYRGLLPMQLDTHGSLTATITDSVAKHLWPYRAGLKQRIFFGKILEERAMKWFEYTIFFSRRFEFDRAIAYADVASHNHFVSVEGRRVYNRTAPLIVLSSTCDQEHFGILGLLNNSTACFWFKQVCFPKGGDRMGTEGARVSPNLWEERFAHDGAKVGKFPIVETRPFNLAQRLDALAQNFAGSLPQAVVDARVPTRTILDAARRAAAAARAEMIARQE